MKWRKGEGADQVEDRRGLGGIPIGAGGGLGLIGVVIAVIVALVGGGGGGGGGGINLPDILDQLPGMTPAQPGESPTQGQPIEDDAEQFIGFVINDIQDAWEAEFQAAGRQYDRTTVVLFTQAVGSGCGNATSAVGPFYCPVDSKVYMDLDFFKELQDRFGVEGSAAEVASFAQAYVLAHEVGHHVQNVLGISGDVHSRRQSDPDEANELSVRLELQADCFAGVWAHSAYAEDLLEPGDMEQALDAAAAVGDDRIQEQTTGQVNPETWRHGSAEQRTKWF